MKRICLLLPALFWLLPLHAQQAKEKPKPLVVDLLDFTTLDKAAFKTKYDGKLVEFMGVADWKVEDQETEKPWFKLVRSYNLPAKGDEAKKMQVARAEVRAYVTGNRGQAEGELKKWKNSRWQCEFTVHGTMKVGEQIVIEDARLTFIHRVPRGKAP